MSATIFACDRAPRVARERILIGLLLCVVVGQSSRAADQDWPVVGGDPGCLRYSSLDQINRRNVNTLRVAWTYHSGDCGKATTIDCTPIVIAGTMFVTTPTCRAVCPDAERGSEHRSYAP